MATYLEENTTKHNRICFLVDMIARPVIEMLQVICTFYVNHTYKIEGISFKDSQ